MLGQRAGAGQYAFSTSQYFMLRVPACWRFGHDALNQSWGPSVTLAHIQCGAKHITVTRYWANGERQRRWANISPALGQHLAFDRQHDRKCQH